MATGSNGQKACHRIGLRAILGLEPRRIAESIASRRVRREASAAASISSSASRRATARLAEGELVLGQRAGLVAAQDVHARHFLDGDEPRHDRLHLRSRSAPTAMVTESTAGSATGIEATVRMSANCTVSSSGSRRKSARPPDDEHQADRGQDEEIADFQHRALEMGDGLRLFDEMRRLAEIGVHAGRGDDSLHLAVLGDRAGIGVVAGLLVDRQRFPGQRRLVDAEIIAFDQCRSAGMMLPSRISTTSPGTSRRASTSSHVPLRDTRL